MKFTEGVKPPLDELSHFGVKGMHWGQRKSVNLPMHSSFNVGMQRRDRQEFGNAGVRRINAHLHAGLDHKAARLKESKHQSRVRTTVQLSVLGTAAAVKFGPTAWKVAKISGHLASMGVATLANKNRMKAGATAIRAISATAGKVPYAKIAHGAFKVTTL